MYVPSHGVYRVDAQCCVIRSARMPDRDGSSAPATSRGLQLMPELEKLLQSLIAKTSNANDRTADMASQTLVHVACHSSIGPRCICQVLLEYSPADQVTAKWRSPFTPLLCYISVCMCVAVQAGWRPLVGRIGVLQAVLGEFGVGTRSGLTIDAVTRVIRDAFSNPSVKASENTMSACSTLW